MNNMETMCKRARAFLLTAGRAARRWTIPALVWAAVSGGAEPPHEAASADVRSAVLTFLDRSAGGPAAFAEAREGILKLGPAAEPALVSRLAAKDAGERANAVTFLGLLKSATSIPYFLAKQRDPDPEVRIAALEALGGFGDTNLIDRIAAGYLNDPHPSVRDVAVIELGRYRSERALPYLVKALEDTDEYARECARKGLRDFSGTTMEGKTEEEKNKAWKQWYDARVEAAKGL